MASSARSSAPLFYSLNLFFFLATAANCPAPSTAIVNRKMLGNLVNLQENIPGLPWSTRSCPRDALKFCVGAKIGNPPKELYHLPLGNLVNLPANIPGMPWLTRFYPRDKFGVGANVPKGLVNRKIRNPPKELYRLLLGNLVSLQANIPVTPWSTRSCPRDNLKFGVGANVLNGLVNCKIVIQSKELYHLVLENLVNFQANIPGLPWSTHSCSWDTLKFGVGANMINGLANHKIGNPPKELYRLLLRNLANLQANYPGTPWSTRSCPRYTLKFGVGANVLNGLVNRKIVNPRLVLGNLVNFQANIPGMPWLRRSCPRDTLKFGVGANVLNGLVNLKIGKPSMELYRLLLGNLVNLKANIPGTPWSTRSCPRDTLKFGVGANEVYGLVDLKIENPLVNLNLQAKICVCITIKATILGNNVAIPVDLNLLLRYFGKKVPAGSPCA